MIKISEIKKDETFYECEYGENVEFVALEDAYLDEDNCWNVKGEDVESGEIVDFSQAEDSPYCYPKLYRWPAYL